MQQLRMACGWRCRGTAHYSDVFVEAQHSHVVRARLHDWSQSEQRRSLLLSTRTQSILRHGICVLLFPRVYGNAGFSRTWSVLKCGLLANSLECHAIGVLLLSEVCWNGGFTPSPRSVTESVLHFFLECVKMQALHHLPGVSQNVFCSSL